MSPLTPSRVNERPPGSVRRVIVLGSTGSIGTQTLSVIEHLNRLHAAGRSATRYEVVGLAAGRNAGLLAEQALKHGVRDVALTDLSEMGRTPALDADLRTRCGADAAQRLIRDVNCDVVVAAIVGIAGLAATLDAVRLGRVIALANKETLVAAGAIVIPEAIRHGSQLLPVDSEHAALWQCLSAVADPGSCPPMSLPASVSRVILTASGGPFRELPIAQMHKATPEMALKHPTWAMGAKVTIDCASLMNKGLELIEAHWLFGVPSSKLSAIIHPQSIVHALAEMADGSLLAQMASPDMRLPIQQSLSHPERLEGASRRLDLSTLSRLEFFAPDRERFPALALATRAIETEGTAGAILNAANEVAVTAFLDGRVAFGMIPRLVADAMDAICPQPIASLDDVMHADAETRRYVNARLDASAYSGTRPSVRLGS